MPNRWLEVVCRYFCCFLMLLYGFVKLFQAQFYTDYHWLDTQLGHLTGQELAWSFYSHSPAFESLMGLAEVTLGGLLLFPRTTALGALFFVPFMIHLVLLNLVFEIGALGSALPLFAAGCYLIWNRWPQVRLLWAVPREQSAVRILTLSRICVCVLPCALAALIIYNNKWRFLQDPKLRGAWEVVAPTDQNVKRIYFEKGRQCWIRDDSNQLFEGQYIVDLPNGLRLQGFEKPIDIDEYSLTNPDALVLKTHAETWYLKRTR